jgi:uncharacterized protein YecE (DUF72 family)
MALHVGTSGWAYPEWRGAFYPDRLPQARFLDHYAAVLTACEANATFYRLQAPSSFARWAAAVPDRFRFAVKAHRRLSHRRRLAPSPEEAEFAKQFAASLDPLGQKLGCLLIQFPPIVERDDAGLERVLDRLPVQLPVACEFHHASWEAPAVEERLAERGGTVCVREESGEAPARLAPGRIAYVRLKGEHYRDRERAALLELLVREAADRDVYVFARHKGVRADDEHTGVGLAQWIVKQVISN